MASSRYSREGAFFVLIDPILKCDGFSKFGTFFFGQFIFRYLTK